MLKLRLQRRGKNNHATFRVVVADASAPIKGRFIADVGSYNPHTNVFNVNKEEVTTWLKQGVQPSATIHNLLIENKVTTGTKVTIWKPPVKKEDTTAAAPATEATPEEKPAEAKTETPAGETKPEEAAPTETKE